MLVKDWLSVVSTASNIKVVDGNITEYGTKKSIEKKYGVFDLKKVEQVNGTDLLVLYISTKCPFYRTRIIKRRLTEYERGYYAALHGGVYIDCVDEKQSYCSGTKNRDNCDCGGDKRKCDFYSVK